MMKFKEMLFSESTAGSSLGLLNSNWSPNNFVNGKSTSWLRLSLDRLRRRHLFRHGSYFRLRCFLPVLVLSLVWLKISHPAALLNTHSLLNATITMRHLLLAVGIVVFWNVSLLLKPHRMISLRRDVSGEFQRLVFASLFCGSLLFLGNAMRHTWMRGIDLGLSLTIALIAASTVLLAGAFLASSDLLPNPSRSRRALIVGSGMRTERLRAMVRSSHSRLEIVGCVDDEYMGNNAAVDNYLGTIDKLPELLKEQPVEVVLIGLPIKSMYEKIQNVISVCDSIGVESNYMSDVFKTTHGVRQPASPSPYFVALGDTTRDLRRWIKRGLDLLITVPAFLLISPLLLVIAIVVKLTSPGPVFFVQQRYGLHRQRFPMFKFRSMVVDAEKLQAALETKNEANGPVFKMKSDPRITRVGAFLRRTSLDELPQLINVLRGDMSIVGPRPLPLRDVSRFEESSLLRRFSVPPGITCLWQARGRSNTLFDEWMKLDLEYIDNWSIGLDLSIIAMTVPAVLRGSGAM
jgi:exopolysaccharide biosynthesis polyprenyl glycosylphosphotransferase